jgi:hypothetical protein
MTMPNLSLNRFIVVAKGETVYDEIFHFAPVLGGLILRIISILKKTLTILCSFTGFSKRDF